MHQDLCYQLMKTQGFVQKYAEINYMKTAICMVMKYSKIDLSPTVYTSQHLTKYDICFLC